MDRGQAAINEVVPPQLSSISHRGRDLFDNSWVGKLQLLIEVMLANCTDNWERDYAHLAPDKKGEEAKGL